MATKFAQPMGHVVVVGSCNVDLTYRVPKMPQPGETLTGRSFQIGYGGKGANQAVMAARLGAHVKMIGRVGDDTFGNGVVNNLRTQSVDTASVWTTPAAATGSAAILVDDAGRNSIVVVPGANGLLTLADVHAASETLRAASVLLCQLEVPLLSTHAALRIAHAAGVRTILNSAPATDLSDDLIRAADIIVPNELELARITGMPVDDLEQAKAAARTLLRRDRAAVIVTLGERGALLVQGGESAHFPAANVEAIDTSGAGDAFIGALGALLAASVPIHEAVRKANALAGRSVTRPGTQTSFPTREEAAEVF